MWKSKKVVCVIPARLKSSRFPRKILMPLQGKPLIQWVWEAAKKVSFFDEVVFAIDAQETASAIESFQGRYHFTAESCQSGTDRLIELQTRHLVEADVWVNWQADGPFISERAMTDLLQSCEKEGADVWTLKKKIEDMEEMHSPDVSKVVCDAKGFALYFSRSPLPYYRKVPEGKEKFYYKHVGLYAYTEEALKKISSFGICDLEIIEQLEQLRFLYNGLKVQVHETQEETWEIDLPEHLARAERFLSQRKIIT